MNTKIYLTSFIALSFALPAMAAPSHTGTFPNDGYMQEDYTYTNAATSTNMDGVYEGTVNAVAQYTDIEYTIPAGKYLPANGEEVIDCNVSGSFCPGVPGTVTYTGAAQGLTSCSTVGDGSYTSSDGTGSTADTCYRQCSGNVTIEHATGVTGNDYYGNGADTCEPTECDNGYHVEPGTPDLMTVIGTSEAGTGYTGNMGNGSDFGAGTMSNSVISGDPFAFAVRYSNKGMIKGHGRCSTQSAQRGTTFDTLESGGQNCYCHLDSYTPYGSNTSIALSGLWVSEGTNAWNCENSCASNCGYALWGGDQNRLAFRAAVFGTIESSPAMCEANTITINWGDTDSADVTANEAGTCTYGGNINTPVKAQHKNGKRFVGWTFSKPSGN